MSDIAPHAGSATVSNPSLNLFTIPPTDLSVYSKRYVQINPFTTGINPVTFQIDPQEDYIDFTQSYFEFEVGFKKANGGNLVAAENAFPVNNLSHSMIKQMNVRLNQTLISEQSDTYSYKAYIETLLHHDRQDGETVLTPEGWQNYVDVPPLYTANNLDNATPDAAWTALPENQKTSITKARGERAKYVGGKKNIMRFKPHSELFNLNKLIITGIQIDLQIYFNNPEFYWNSVGGIATRLAEADIKVRLVLCQFRINPDVYRELAVKMESSKAVSYPTVRSEIRTYSFANDRRQYEINNPWQGRGPNLVVMALVDTRAFNGDYTRDPFCFQKMSLSNVKQLFRGEEYPYETLEIKHDGNDLDNRGYYRFLQATECLRKDRGNMLTEKDWGHNKNCTLFCFNNAANGDLFSSVLNPKQLGEIRYILNFGANPAANFTVILFAEFENLLEIDKNKAVTYDVYQR